MAVDWYRFRPDWGEIGYKLTSDNAEFFGRNQGPDLGFMNWLFQNLTDQIIPGLLQSHPELDDWLHTGGRYSLQSLFCVQWDWLACPSIDSSKYQPRFQFKSQLHKSGWIDHVSIIMMTYYDTEMSELWSCFGLYFRYECINPGEGLFDSNLQFFTYDGIFKSHCNRDQSWTGIPSTLTCKGTRERCSKFDNRFGHNFVKQVTTENEAMLLFHAIFGRT